MFIRQLGYLVALARERHFARAAASCNVSQPTLSAGIRSLEEELGITLVMRGHRFVGLTAEGERVLAWAQRSLADLDNLKQELAERHEGLAGRLRVGAVPTALPLVATLLGQLLAVHPNLSVEIASVTSNQIQQGLDEFALDLGITYLDNEPLKAVRRLPLHEEHYFLIAPRGHRLAGRETIGWDELADCALCLLSPTMQNRRIIDAALARAETRTQARIEADSFVPLVAFLKTGAWTSIFPDAYLPFVSDEQDLVIIPLEPPVRPQTIGLIYADREPVQPAVRAVLSLAKKLARATTTAP